MIYLHKNLKYLRKQAKLSQMGLAEALSFSRSNIAAYEAGNSEPNLKKLLQISNYFNVSIRDFISKDLSSPEYLNTNQINKNVSNLAFEEYSDFVSKTAETKDMIAGFKQFFKFRLSKHSNPSKDLALLANDYENLLQVAEDLLDINTIIIKKIEAR